MSLLTDALRNHQIKRLAHEMPGRLAKNYGVGNFYTLAQIDITFAELKLDPAVLVYGYAMWLSAGMFELQRAKIGGEIGYEEARAAVRSHIHQMPSEVESSSAPSSLVGLPRDC